MNALKWLWGYLKGYKAEYVVIFLFTLVFIAGAFLLLWDVLLMSL